MINRDDFLIGAGAGNAVGGLIGVAVLPLGWDTLVCLIAVVVGWYICKRTWQEKYKE